MDEALRQRVFHNIHLYIYINSSAFTFHFFKLFYRCLSFKLTLHIDTRVCHVTI